MFEGTPRQLLTAENSPTSEYVSLLALRPAPVVVEWFNMYAITGMSCVDYLIGDNVVIPHRSIA